MINLIPPESKKSLKREYLMRVFTVWSGMISLAFLSGTLLLWPIYVYVNSLLVGYQSTAEAASEKVANYEQATKLLQQASNHAIQIENEKQNTPLSQYINLIERLKGDGITVNDMAVSRKDASINPISVTGVANTRQDLAAFRERILQEKGVEAVDLPLSSLAKDKNVPFSITIKFKATK